MDTPLAARARGIATSFGDVSALDGIDPDMVAAHRSGTDWCCVISWHLSDVEAASAAIYRLDVAAHGRSVAGGDGPEEVDGHFQV
jgi:hypothetical protein